MKNMITFLTIISDIPEQILLQQTEVYLDKEKSLLYIHIYLYTVIISYYVHNSLFSKVFQSVATLLYYHHCPTEKFGD